MSEYDTSEKRFGITSWCLVSSSKHFPNVLKAPDVEKFLTSSREQGVYGLLRHEVQVDSASCSAHLGLAEQNIAEGEMI